MNAIAQPSNRHLERASFPCSLLGLAQSPSSGGPRGFRARFDPHRALFVLPSLFTLGNIFCGFLAITLCFGEPGPEGIRHASLAILLGAALDLFDGRVARLTRTQSDFGVQLDSLADLATFGVAPAVVLHRWCLEDLGGLGLAIAFMYVAAGALRLARFNVQAARGLGESGKAFVGLPIPLAAGTVVSLVLASYPAPDPPFGGAAGTALVTLTLAGLMVSSLPYRSFKDVRPSRRNIKRTMAGVTALGTVVVALSIYTRPALALVALALGYVAFGVVEGILGLGLRPHTPESVEEG